jgi:hypothetical protein
MVVTQPANNTAEIRMVIRNIAPPVELMLHGIWGYINKNPHSEEQGLEVSQAQLTP